jgi:TonB family protein
MNIGATVVLAATVAAAPLVSMANPYPAGACVVVDDGVYSSARLQAPRAISMTLPFGDVDRGDLLDHSAVVDLSFVIRPGGSVADARVLCAVPRNSRFSAALLKSAAAWRFSPERGPGDHGRRVAYRVVVRGAPPTLDLIYLGPQPVS